MLLDRWNPRLWLRDWLRKQIRLVLEQETRPGGLISESIRASMPPTMSGPVNLHAQGTPSAVVGRSGASR